MGTGRQGGGGGWWWVVVGEGWEDRGHSLINRRLINRRAIDNGRRRSRRGNICI